MSDVVHKPRFNASLVEITTVKHTKINSTWVAVPNLTNFDYQYCNTIGLILLVH